MTTTQTKVTAANIDEVRETMPARDQARELELGCATWGITYQGGQRGQMTRWPSGRGAVCFGGDSIWGEWAVIDDGRGGMDVLLADDTDDDGRQIAYDEDGGPVVMGR